MLQGVGRGATESVLETSAVLRTVSDTAESITAYRGSHGRKIRAPKISFGVTKKKNVNLVMTSKHNNVIIEWSSGFKQIAVGPMGQES